MWKLLDQSKLKNVGGHGDICKRVYGEDGKLWPRLVLSIYDDIIWLSGGLKVAANIRKDDNKNTWWSEYGIPYELVDDMKELLDEAKAIRARIPCKRL